MNMAVFMAIGAAIFSTVNDLIYRKSGTGGDKANLHFFYFISSLFTTIFTLIMLFILQNEFRFERNELYYGVVFGIGSFFAYLLFLYSFNGSNTIIVVTLYRLNMIPGIVLAVIFLGEEIKISRILGILLFVICMLFFSGIKVGIKSEIKNKYFITGVAACLCAGVLNMISKAAVLKGIEVFHMTFWRFLTVTIMSSFLFLYKKPKTIKIRNFAYPIFSGVFLLLSVFFVLEALKIGDVSLVIPIAQISFFLIAIISWLFFKEKFEITKFLGVLTALLAIVIISL